MLNPAKPALLLKATAPDSWLTTGRFALFLALLIAAAFPGVLHGGRTFVFRDFGLFGYPLAYFHRQAFWQGELPLWNPLNNCGLPFLAQWNTLCFYPCSLIYLLLPIPWSLSFFCLAHLFWGGLGMYVLANHWTRHRLAAALAGVVFAFNGLSLNALMWPNIEATLGWLPWVVWLAQRAWLEGGKTLVWAVLAGATQMLAGGPEPILFTWLILFTLASGDWITRAVSRSRILARFCLLGALVALVSAVQLLPFLQLLAHSQRDTGFSSASHDWSMPFWGWNNFLVPLFRTSPTAQGVFFQNGQYWTSSYYVGVGTVFLGAVAFWRVREWRVRLLAGLVFLGAVLALGEGTLLYSAVRACLPGFGLLRYPVKAVVLVTTLAPLLAAIGITWLARAEGGGSFEVGVAALLFFLIAAVVACDWRSPIPADVWRATWHSGLSRTGFLCLILAILGLVFAPRCRRNRALGGVLLVVFWLDLLTHTPNQNPSADPSIYAAGRVRAQQKSDPPPRLGCGRVMVSPEALEYLKSNPMPNPGETYMQNRAALRVDCNLLDNVPQIDGFFSLIPREIGRVTALPYDQPSRPFPALLDFMGVTQATAPGSTTNWVPRPTAMPLITTGQQPLFADDSTALEDLSHTDLDPRHTVLLPIEARGAISACAQPTARVFDATFSNHRISFGAVAPAPSIVVVSQTWYPAWKARIDGIPAKVWRANYAFQALEVPAGRHRIELAYEDRMLQMGAVLSACGLLICGGLLCIVARLQQPQPAVPAGAE